MQMLSATVCHAYLVNNCFFFHYLQDQYKIVAILAIQNAVSFLKKICISNIIREMLSFKNITGFKCCQLESQKFCEF